jgi:hypothetical protein
LDLARDRGHLPHLPHLLPSLRVARQLQLLRNTKPRLDTEEPTTLKYAVRLSLPGLPLTLRRPELKLARLTHVQSVISAMKKHRAPPFNQCDDAYDNCLIG